MTARPTPACHAARSAAAAPPAAPACTRRRPAQPGRLPCRPPPHVQGLRLYALTNHLIAKHVEREDGDAVAAAAALFAVVSQPAVPSCCSGGRDGRTWAGQEALCSG